MFTANRFLSCFPLLFFSFFYLFVCLSAYRGAPTFLKVILMFWPFVQRSISFSGLSFYVSAMSPADAGLFHSATTCWRLKLQLMWYLALLDSWMLCAIELWLLFIMCWWSFAYVDVQNTTFLMAQKLTTWGPCDAIHSRDDRNLHGSSTPTNCPKTADSWDQHGTLQPPMSGRDAPQPC